AAVGLASGGGDADETGDPGGADAAEIGARTDVQEHVVAVGPERRQTEADAAGRHQPGTHGPVVVVVILLPGHARIRAYPADVSRRLPTEAGNERVALLMTERHRGRARSRFRPRVYLRFLVGEPRERSVTPAGVVEPPAAERARHEMRAVRGTVFGPATRAE